MATIKRLIASLEQENKERLESIAGCKDHIDRLSTRIIKHQRKVDENNETLGFLQEARSIQRRFEEIKANQDTHAIVEPTTAIKTHSFESVSSDTEQCYRWNGAYWCFIDEAMVYMSECRDMWE